MYSEQTFSLPELRGLSAKQIEVHLKLYAGYVKNTNAVLAKLDEYRGNAEANAIAINELTRRLPFEFNGMRLHELYFEALGGDGQATGGLVDALAAQWGSFDAWKAEFVAVGSLRGIGWAILAYDAKAKRFINHWVSDHELGHLGGLNVIIAMDVWEHAFMVDYVPADRSKYISAFFDNLKWDVVTARYSA